MDLRNFFLSQNVQPEEMNGMLAAIDQAIGQISYETGLRGVAYGLAVSQTSPASMAVKVTKGTALFYDPTVPGSTSNRKAQACRISADTSISISAGYLGAGTAVTSGQERYVSIVVRPKTANSDPRTAIDGSTVNFVTTEIGELIVVPGSAVAAGTAQRPSISQLGIRLADVLVTYGMSVAPVPNVAAREDLYSTLTGRGALTDCSGYSLFWKSSIEPYRLGVLRAYLCAGDSGYGPQGALLTLNAWWEENTKKWYSTDGQPCYGVRLTGAGLQLIQRVTGLTNGWAEVPSGNWENMVTLDANGLMISSTPVTVVAVIQGGAPTVALPGGAVPPMGVFVPFPRPFATTPTQISVSSVPDSYPGSDNWQGIGSSHDANVSVVYMTANPYGIYVRVQPTALGLFTCYSRLITVSQ